MKITAELIKEVLARCVVGIDFEKHISDELNELKAVEKARLEAVIAETKEIKRHEAELARIRELKGVECWHPKALQESRTGGDSGPYAYVMCTLCGREIRE